MQRRSAVLWLCAVVLWGITLLNHGAALASYEQRRTYQESPLSPLATPLTSTLPLSLPAAVTVPVTIVTPSVVTIPMTSPLTVTVTEAVPAPVTATAPPVATVDLVNPGQISLLLVGAVLGGILVAIAVVLGRHR